VSGCPQSKYFEAEENLLFDFEFFIGGRYKNKANLRLRRCPGLPGFIAVD
jgi:hypothetical protein